MRWPEPVLHPFLHLPRGSTETFQGLFLLPREESMRGRGLGQRWERRGAVQPVHTWATLPVALIVVLLVSLHPFRARQWESCGGQVSGQPPAWGALGRGGWGETTLQCVALTIVSFDVLRSVVFFYIKSPLRVEEAGLQELIPTTWWPHRSSKEVGSASPRCPGCSAPQIVCHALALVHHG